MNSKNAETLGGCGDGIHTLTVRVFPDSMSRTFYIELNDHPSSNLSIQSGDCKFSEEKNYLIHN